MTPQDAIVWLLATLVVLTLVMLALVAFCAWKARMLVDAQLKAAAGGELSAAAAWSASVACHAIAKELRPVVYGQAADDPSAPPDFSGLVQPGA